MREKRQIFLTEKSQIHGDILPSGIPFPLWESMSWTELGTYFQRTENGKGKTVTLQGGNKQLKVKIISHVDIV